jgi:hypothetical protein
MKTPLKILILLNLVLLGGLIFFVLTAREKTVLRTEPLALAPAPAPALPPPAQAQITPAPFRWSQLDSTDYHDYVKNLRAIGCPEPTVRAIVTSDVDSVYQIIARQLEQKLADLAGGSWTQQFSAARSEESLKLQLQKIPEEENLKIADLLGLPPPPEQVATTESLSAPDTSSLPTNVPGPMPLVLQNIDPTALNLTGEQTLVIQNIRQKFLEQVGGANQDPNDPAYQARWQNAQTAADNMLRGMLGYQVFAQYQTMETAAENPAPATQ